MSGKTGIQRTVTARRYVAGLAFAIAAIAVVGEAGIIRSGIAGGRITAFASIFVNGREIDIAQAVITIDGEPATEADLRLGQIVEVFGQFDDELPVGTATTVAVSDSVEGTVESVSPGTNRLTVLGQTVVTDGETVFDLQSGAIGLGAIRVGDVVEVGGIVNAANEVLASRIEQKAPGGDFEVTGLVTNLIGSTFTLNGLTVDFSAAELRDFPTGMINAGDAVEAKGTSIVPGVLAASRVEFQAGLPLALGDFVDLEGFVTTFVSAQEFSLGGVEVATDASTVFENGGPGNLILGSQIEVTGLVNAGGVVDATRIRFQKAKIKIEATVTSVGQEDFEVLEIPIAPTESTRWRDKSDADVSNFSLSDLSPGDFVEVRSFKNPGRELPVVAKRIRREDHDDEAELRGFVSRAGQHDFEVMGVTIDVGSKTEYESATGADVDAVTFFDLALEGTLVTVEGEQTGNGRIFAEEIEIE